MAPSGDIARASAPSTGLVGMRGLVGRILVDPRHLQIAALSVLLVYGLGALGLEVRAPQVAVTLATALFAEWAASRLLAGPRCPPRFEPRSALISGLSLCLLLRSNQVAWAVIAAVIAIFSKRMIRIRKKHVFNPTNLAIVALLLSTREVWVSPGQWGSSAILGLFFSCAGIIVTSRAVRADVTLAFLGAHATLLFLRAWWLGDPLSIPVHQLENGALLLFAFFMISDPRTTPDARAGRIAFAVLVAALGYVLRFSYFQPNALLYSLAALSPLVVVIDRVLTAPAYAWPSPEAHAKK